MHRFKEKNLEFFSPPPQTSTTSLHHPGVRCSCITAT